MYLKILGFLLTSLGGQENGHHAAFQLGGLVQTCGFGALLCEPVQQVLTDLSMGHLSAAEANGDLDTVAISDELLGILELGVEIADIDARRHANLLDLHHVLVLLCFLLLLALLETELAVVHQLANGRDSLGRDLDKIQTLFIGDLQRLIGGHDAHLFTFGTNQADLLVVDILIQFMH